MTTPIPFRVSIPEEHLADLKARLLHTRWPDEPTDASWMMGTNLDYMKKLTIYWTNDYDWRKAEAGINALSNFEVAIDGIDLHFVHHQSKKADAKPLLLLHGWPDRQTAGNVVQFHDMEKAGHFAAWEDPAVYMEDIKQFASLLK